MKKNTAKRRKKKPCSERKTLFPTSMSISPHKAEADLILARHRAYTECFRLARKRKVNYIA